MWLLIAAMIKNLVKVKNNHRTAQRYLLAFILLALGDMFHVGFPVFISISGWLEVYYSIANVGALLTAITITIFYMIFVDIWRVYFSKEKNWVYYLLLTIGIIRLIIILIPQSRLENRTLPIEWNLIRNIPLLILGLTIAFLMYWDGNLKNDTHFKNISYSIFASFAFYLPVILFASRVPSLGMLMIPKSIAYLVMAWLGYRYFFLGFEKFN
jgi:hypothetical protein